MILLLEFLFPVMFFAMVGFFAYQWRKGVKAGYFQKNKAPKRGGCDGNCANCKRNK